MAKRKTDVIRGFIVGIPLLVLGSLHHEQVRIDTLKREQFNEQQNQEIPRLDGRVDSIKYEQLKEASKLDGR